MNSTVGPRPPSEQYWRDRQWIHDHFDELLRGHTNQWIAVRKSKVIASGDELGSVQHSVQSINIDPDIVYQFIDDGSLILHS